MNVPDTDGRGLKDKVLQETCSVLLPIGVEMFHNMIKMITQKNFVEICRSPKTQYVPAKSPPQHYRATGSPQCRGQAFRPLPFS